MEKKLNDLAMQNGLATAELVEDVVAGYVHELTVVRATLDQRYDDLESGRVEPIDSEGFFEKLRQREEEFLKQFSPK